MKFDITLPVLCVCLAKAMLNLRAKMGLSDLTHFNY